MSVKTTRFSGADWGDQLRTVNLIGVGGIGSWTALNLARIGHELYLIDADSVDETNVTGGQMYRNTDVSKTKVSAVETICREFGCTNPIYGLADWYKGEELYETFERTEGFEFFPKIIVNGLDNMKTRKQTFEDWKKYCDICTEEENKQNIFIDGRLNCEMWEIFTMRGDNKRAMAKYAEEYLFSDAESPDLDCTNKQSTFGAMSISASITATLCNLLTNEKLGVEFREVPFYQRSYFPLFESRKEVVSEAVEIKSETI